MDIKQWLERVDSSHIQAVLQQCMMDARNSTASPDAVEFEEYSLIKILEKQALFEGLENLPASLGLFAKHFLTRRGLYQSQSFWQAKGCRLEFGLMRIKLVKYHDPIVADGQALMGLGEQAIADFYGDINVLKEATQESVNNLLSDFWQRYDAYINASDAYAALNIKPDATWVDIQKAYRKLAAKHHPDKGGNAEAFGRIKKAYDQLKRLQRNELK